MHRRSRLGCRANIKKNIKETERRIVDWISLALDKDQ
jgi:hypothetical protein